MVTAVILGWAVCLQHTLKVEFCQNPCSVNVRVFVDVKASDPRKPQSTPPKNDATGPHYPIKPPHLFFNKYSILLEMDGKP